MEKLFICQFEQISMRDELRSIGAPAGLGKIHRSNWINKMRLEASVQYKLTFWQAVEIDTYAPDIK